MRQRARFGGPFFSAALAASFCLIEVAPAQPRESSIYLRFLLGETKTKEAAGVLSRASLEEMWKPIALVETVGEDRVDMGLCFFIEKRGSRKLIGHSGSQNGFISHLYLDPFAHAGYVVSFNTDATDDVAVPNTRKLDAEVREFFVANVAPALEAASSKR